MSGEDKFFILPEKADYNKFWCKKKNVKVVKRLVSHNLRYIFTLAIYNGAASLQYIKRTRHMFVVSDVTEVSAISQFIWDRQNLAWQ